MYRLHMENKNEKLLAYIAKCRKENVLDLITRDNLVHAGWSKEVVDKALGNEIPVPQPEEHEKGSRSMWDAFEHVLLFISLYVFTISVGSVLYTLIDRMLPLSTYSNYSSSSITSALAAVIVSFPLFAYLFIRISKRTEQVPTVRTLPVRKFLIYATLVVAFVVALVNLTGLVYNLLSGDLTSNFLLKAVVVLSITATVAVHYLIQIKEDAAVN